jgi:hypothetical protein
MHVIPFQMIVPMVGGSTRVNLLSSPQHQRSKSPRLLIVSPRKRLGNNCRGAEPVVSYRNDGTDAGRTIRGVEGTSRSFCRKMILAVVCHMTTGGAAMESA